MNKRAIFFLKLAVLLTVLGLVGWQLWKSWRQVSDKHIAIDWRWGILAVGGFCCSMLTGGIVWRWLASKMAPPSPDKSRGDSLPTIPLLGAYTFSQLGKYFPGKVALLLMRIERAARIGMSARICTLSTLLENALFMVSGGLVGMLAIFKVAGQMDPWPRRFLWLVTIGGMAALAVGCYPPVFYGLVNRLLARMKKPAVDRAHWLGVTTLFAGVLAFIPCWIFGGIALWAAASALHPVGLVESWWFAAAYALSVIVGMASLLPGGAGVRDAMLGVAVMMQFQHAGIAHADAIILAGVVAIVQRLFQVAAELIMGSLGALAARPPRSNPLDDKAPIA